jgi:hypothetical protein
VGVVIELPGVAAFDLPDALLSQVPGECGSEVAVGLDHAAGGVIE